MAELLRSRPALKAEWIVSVGLDLLATASLITVVHEYEGLSMWLHEAHSAASPRLRHELHLALRATKYPQAVLEAFAAEMLGPKARGHTDVHAFFDDLAALDETTCQRIAETVLDRSLKRHDINVDASPHNILANEELLTATLQRLAPPVDVADAARLLREPTEWRDLLLNALRRFWDRLYKQQWEQSVDQLNRSIEYHRRQQYPADFTGMFMAVTGRQVPERLQSRLGEIEQVRFVPSLHFGPYVAFLVADQLATIFYNGEGAPTEPALDGTFIEELYHPMAALADKTRLTILKMLDGTELYAQEIVDRLGISQSAVSRHLQLMVDMKVLNVRRGERGAKFYSINVPVLQQLAQRLSQFRS